MNAINPVAPYSVTNSHPKFSPPQSVDDLAKIPLQPLDKNFIITSAQNPNNPNTGWVKGFYVSNSGANLDASVQEARDYVKANYPTLDPNQVFVSSPSQIPGESTVLAPRQVLITGSDGKISQIGRIQDTVSAGRFQPPSIEEKSIFQKTGLSNLHPELANYNPFTDKNIPPNSNIQSSSPQPAIENKSGKEDGDKVEKKSDKEGGDTDNDKADSERVSTTHRKSSIKPLGWGESLDKKA